MIDRKDGYKPVHFEVSIGNFRDKSAASDILSYMIDRKVGDKRVHFEISIGKFEDKSVTIL